VNRGGDRVHLSVVVPAFDEEDRLTRTLPAIGEWLASSRIDGEVLIVDDGSADGTSRVATAWLAGPPGRLLRIAENRGKGHAVRRGLLEASGRWALVTDADLSTPLGEHAKLAAAARDHDLDVVIGSRALPDSRIEVRQNVVRETMGKTFNLLVRLMTGLPYRDTQCGFKLLDLRRVRPLVERMVVDRFAWDVELLFLCWRFGLAVREVPVVWHNDPHTTVGLVADPLRMLADVVRVRWRFRRGLYNPDVPAPGG
jgi:glycosyltransferase involved in cell wall biosynthesis